MNLGSTPAKLRFLSCDNRQQPPGLLYMVPWDLGNRGADGNLEFMLPAVRE